MTRPKNPKLIILAGAILLVVSFLQSVRAAGGIDQIFTVTPSFGPDSITFNWDDAVTVEGEIYRRDLGTRDWPAPIGVLTVGSNSYTDATIEVGKAYEYRFEHSDLYAYLASGVDLPLADDRGKVILLVDQTVAGPCAAELGILTKDLVGDGWEVVRHDVPRDNGNDADMSDVLTVKNIILTEHAGDPENVKAVLIFGHVPVPYSGNNNTDAHFRRALPADGYYGELDGTWTDTQDLITNASQTRWKNVAGDGKFDQGVWPSDVDLMVGRIDMSSLPAYSSSEMDLLKRYVAKNHAWRHKKVTADNKAVLMETISGRNWGPWNFIRQFGLEVATRNELDALYSEKNLFGYLGNVGNYTSVNGISSDDMAARNVKSVFLFEGGSYSLDWDVPDAFMRSIVAASGTTLASGWSEFPAYYHHQMGLGETIGFTIRAMQNATKDDYKANYFLGTRAISHTMQGDPTIRVHQVAPPTDAVAISEGGGVRLSWGASPESEISGYHVYRAADFTSPFTRITSSPVSSINYLDATARSGDVVYMIRAVKMENGTGTYENASQGIFAPFAVDGSANTAPVAAVANTILDRDGSGPVTLSGTDPDGDDLTFLIVDYPSSGLITGAGETFSYVPFEGFTGSDSFTYLATDANGGNSAVQTANIVVQPGPDDPVEGVQLEAEAFDGSATNIAGIVSDPSASFGARAGNLRNGEWLLYENLDFDLGVTTFDIRLANATGGSRIELRLDDPAGELIGVVKPNPLDTVISVGLSEIVTGGHDLYLVMAGGTGNLLEIDWFRFNAEGLSFASTYQAEASDENNGCTEGTAGAVTYMNYNEGSNHLQWNTIDGGEGGIQPVTLHYANGSGTSQQATLAFRSPKESIGKYDLPETGGLDQWGTVTIDVELRPGLNEFRIAASGSSEDTPRSRLDRLVVGADRVLDPSAAFEAEANDEENLVTVSSGPGGSTVTPTASGAWVRFERFRFGENPGKVEVTLSGAGIVEFRLDGVAGELIGTATGGSATSQTTVIETLSRSPDRIHDLYLVFPGGAGSVEIDRFRFVESDGLIYDGDHRPDDPLSVDVSNGEFSVIFAQDLSDAEELLVPQLSFDLTDPWLAGEAHVDQTDLGIADGYRFLRATSLTPISEAPAQFFRVVPAQ